MKTIILFAVVVCAVQLSKADSSYAIRKPKECQSNADCKRHECCARERDPGIVSKRKKRLTDARFAPIKLKSYCKPYKKLGESCGANVFTGECPCDPRDGLKCEPIRNNVKSDASRARRRILPSKCVKA